MKCILARWPRVETFIPEWKTTFLHMIEQILLALPDVRKEALDYDNYTVDIFKGTRKISLNSMLLNMHHLSYRDYSLSFWIPI